MSKNKMTAMEIDAIGEILNISLGSSATAASTMLNARVDITTPVVQVKSREEFEFSNLEPAVGVEITYVEGLSGGNIMLLKRSDVKVIVEKMMGIEMSDEEFELNEMNISAICEVMNQMMGASATALAELLSRTINISTPISFEIDDSDKFIDNYFIEGQPMVVVQFNLKIGDEMESEFMNIIPIELAKDLVSGFFPDGAVDFDEEEEGEPQGGGDKLMSEEEIQALLQQEATAAPQPQAEQSQGGGDKMMSQEEIQALLQQEATAAPQPQAEQSQGGGDKMMSQEEIQALLQQEATAAPQPQPQPQVQPQQPIPSMGAGIAPADANAVAANTMMMQQMMDMMRQQMELQRQELHEMMEMQKTSAAPKQIKVNPMPKPNLSMGEGAGDPDANLDLIMGVPLDVSVEIGRTKKLVKDILELNKGSLVVLNKLAGEQVDIFVNGQCIAKGDVVVVDDNFGVRITEILQDEIVVEP